MILSYSCSFVFLFQACDGSRLNLAGCRSWLHIKLGCGGLELSLLSAAGVAIGSRVAGRGFRCRFRAS